MLPTPLPEAKTEMTQSSGDAYYVQQRKIYARTEALASRGALKNVLTRWGNKNKAMIVTAFGGLKLDTQLKERCDHTAVQESSLLAFFAATPFPSASGLLAAAPAARPALRATPSCNHRTWVAGP